MNASHRFIVVLATCAALLAALSYGYLVFKQKTRDVQETSVTRVNPAVQDWGSPPDENDPNKYVVKSHAIAQGVVEVDFDISLLPSYQIARMPKPHPALTCFKLGCPGVVEQK